MIHVVKAAVAGAACVKSFTGLSAGLALWTHHNATTIQCFCCCCFLPSFLPFSLHSCPPSLPACCCCPHQATKLLKASILKVDVSDLELDEDELAAEMAANMGAGGAAGGHEAAAGGNPDLDDVLQQHGLHREQGAAGAAAGGDAEMQDAQEQQENIPPAGSSQQQHQQSSQDKQQQQQTQPQQSGAAASEGGTTGTQQTQAKRTFTISAEKYEFVKVSIEASGTQPTAALSQLLQ